VEQIALLLDELRGDDDTLYVITSDHGESIYEHGILGHGQSLYQSELRVPLIVRFPASESLRGLHEGPVSILDIAPTVLDVLDIPIPEGMMGRSLLPVLRDETASEKRVLYGELKRGPLDVRSVLWGDWKLIVDRRMRKEELFHLGEDPRETRNLVSAHPKVHGELRKILDRQIDDSRRGEGRAPTRPVDMETRRRLEALGYLDSP
jgi:arylsulfatase A-like enzyme